MDFYLVTIVPPVAAAVMNRKAQNSQNHGANAEPTPAKSWMKTAATNGPRRPYLKIECTSKNYCPFTWVCHLQFNVQTYLSANVPNIIFPIKIPVFKEIN